MRKDIFMHNTKFADKLKFLYNASDLTNCRFATYRNFFHNADEKMWIIVNFSAKFLNISFVYLLFKPNDSKNNNF